MSYGPLLLEVTGWVNSAPIDQDALRGRVVVVEAFQMLCPGCVSIGLPQMQRVREAYSPEEVVVLGLHTVFEHHDVMTPQALAAFVSEYQYDFPIAIDRPAQEGPIPATMAHYQLRGTPSTLLVDRSGYVRDISFGALDDLTLGTRIGRLLSEPTPAHNQERA